MAKKASRSGMPPPVCKAIMVCSRVIVDDPTRLWSIIDTFDEVTADEIPTTFGPYLLFLQITDGQGRYQITVEVHDLQADVVVAREEQPDIELRNKHARWSAALTLPEFEITHAGLFDVLVLANGEEIARRTIEVYYQRGHADAEREADS